MREQDPPDLLNRQRIVLARVAAAHDEFRLRAETGQKCANAGGDRLNVEPSPGSLCTRINP
jgi:hypothetical protein